MKVQISVYNFVTLDVAEKVYVYRVRGSMCKLICDYPLDFSSRAAIIVLISSINKFINKISPIIRITIKLQNYSLISGIPTDNFRIFSILQVVD